METFVVRKSGRLPLWALWEMCFIYSNAGTKSKLVRNRLPR